MTTDSRTEFIRHKAAALIVNDASDFRTITEDDIQIAYDLADRLWEGAPEYIELHPIGPFKRAA